MKCLFKRTMPKRSNRSRENPFATSENGTYLIFENDQNHTVLLDVSEKPEHPPKPHYDRQPPVHAHPYQHEWFHCIEGQIGVYLNGKNIILRAGESAFIPMKQWHTYFPIGTAGRTVVWMDPDDAVAGRNEEFFRNYIGYQNDCRDQGLKPSRYQLCLMRSQHDMVLKYGRLPLKACQLLEWINGIIIGKWILKYKVSYPEYYQQ